jgi:putative sterol carrier protein
VPTEGLCGYVDNHVEFETNAEYHLLIEKKTENFYRTISKRTTAFPNSSMQVKKTVLRSNTLALTPQESEQLSVYVSNDNYVKKQKEDIEELASLFKGMLGDTEDDNSYQYMNELKSHFYPLDDLSAVFQIDIPDENISLVLEIQEETLECSRGAAEKADVTAKVSSEVFGQILRGEKTFQSAFMAGELSAQGNFKILRNFDTIFRF